MLRILKIVLRNHGYSDTKEIFSFEINLKDLDTKIFLFKKQNPFYKNFSFKTVHKI